MLLISVVYTAACTPSSIDPACKSAVTRNTAAKVATTVRQEKKRKSLIFFTADNWAAVYLNGVKLGDNNGEWQKVKKVETQIAEGDVVSFEVSDNGIWWGFVASIKWGRQIISTGRDFGWLARRKYNTPENTWKLPSYERICTWKAAVVRPDADKFFEGKVDSKLFRKRGAQYVWSERARENSKIYVRYRVGGETRRCNSDIYYTADSIIEFYLNGKLLSSNDDWTVVKKETKPLGKGDVLAFKVTNLSEWWGAIVGIQGNVRTGTGNDASWRAIKEFAIDGDKNAWMLPNYGDICDWPSAKVRPNGDAAVEGRAKDFPYEATNADYVWAAGAGESDTIFLRFRVGGDGC